MARERLLVAAVSLIATCVFFFEYLPPFKRVYLWSDIAGYHYPLQRYAFQRLKEGHIPLWDPSIYSGISFAGNTQAALFYPPTWLMFAASWRLPRLPFKAVEVFTFAHVWLAFLLCYLWLRSRTAALPAIFGAAVFAYGGYMVYQLLHPGVVCAMTWMPLGFWGIDETVRQRSWRPLWKVAAASALAFLAGYPACWLVHCTMMAAYAIASPRHWRVAAGVCAALLLSTLLFMVELLPAMQARSMMQQEAKYGAGAWGWRTLLLSYFLPNWFDFNFNHPTTYDPGCLYFYLGLPALFGIGWALWQRQLLPYLQPLLTLGFALIMANPFPLLLRTVERIPALLNSMQPHNYYAGVAPMAALITAISLDTFLRKRHESFLPKWAWVVCVAALILWPVRELWILLHHQGRFASRYDSLLQTAIALGMFSAGMWLVGQADGRRRHQVAALLLFAAGVDFKVYGSARWFNAQEGDVDLMHPPYGIPGASDEAYREMFQNRHYRVVTAEGSGPHPTDYRLWGLASPQGFDPFLPAQYKKTIERWVPFRTNRLFYPDLDNDDMLRALGVRYVMVRSTDSTAERLARSSRFRQAGGNGSFSAVFEYLHAKAPYGWEQEGSGTVEPTLWTPERRDFLLRSREGGRFFLVEQYYPGWKAFVDGQPAGIQPWGGAFQAISVPGGAHQITFQFRPSSVTIGAILSLLAIVALGLVARFDWRLRLSSDGASARARSKTS